MRNLFVSNSKNSISRSVLTILIGGVFLFFPRVTMNTVMIIIGTLLLTGGLITLIVSNRLKLFTVKGNWSGQGIMNMVFGIVFITSPSVMVNIFMIFIGIILLLMGLLQLLGGLGLLSRTLWAWILLLIGVVTFGSGVFLLSDPFKSAETIIPFLGAILILNGISQLFIAWKVSRQPKTYKGSDVQDINYEEV